MAAQPQFIHYPRPQAQELVAFLGKLPIESGASHLYTSLRSVLEAPEEAVPESAPTKASKTPAKASKTPAKASATTDDAKTLARKKHAAQNARKWRARKAAERAAAALQENSQTEALPIAPAPTEGPVLFTG